MNELLNIVLRSVTIYFFIVLAIRIFGKKELAQLSVIDLVFILLISNSVQNAMVGNNSSLVGVIVAASSLFVVNIILDRLVFRSKKLSEFFQGNPMMLIYQGHVLEKHLRQATISQDELEAVVREHGVESINEVDLAVLETDGNISVLSKNFSHRTVRRRRAHKLLAKNE
jgi:uncharacterized membrane protein YcaP (DUF421 family)